METPFWKNRSKMQEPSSYCLFYVAIVPCLTVRQLDSMLAHMQKIDSMLAHMQQIDSMLAHM